jgi:hypothetical protein
MMLSSEKLLLEVSIGTISPAKIRDESFGILQFF